MSMTDLANIWLYTEVASHFFSCELEFVLTNRKNMSSAIKNLPELLKNYLGPNKTITDTKICRLTAPGENFGSIMLKLDITLLNKENGTREMLHAVAKMLPEKKEFRELFNVQTTFPNETALYQIIVPSIQNFQKKLGISEVYNGVCGFIAARRNLVDNSDLIDDDAVLVLENLMENGFRNIERTSGFDFETTKLILKDLALFHAVLIAYKMKEPEAFGKNVKPFCHDFKVKIEDIWVNLLKAVLAENETTAPLAPKLKSWGTIPRSAPREPFATVIHCDLWINNTMQKFENGKAVANKLVDFQCYNYGSPAADLFFFLWTSVSLALLESNLDYFIKYYYENFIEVLKEHQCDINQFPFDKFLKEIELECDFEFGHAMLFILFTLNGNQGSLDYTKPPSPEKLMANLLPTTKAKIWFAAEECTKRGWLK